MAHKSPHFYFVLMVVVGLVLLCTALFAFAAPAQPYVLVLSVVKIPKGMSLSGGGIIDGEPKEGLSYPATGDGKRPIVFPGLETCTSAMRAVSAEMMRTPWKQASWTLRCQPAPFYDGQVV